MIQLTGICSIFASEKRYKPLKRSNNETNYIFVSYDARDHRKFWS